MKYGAELWGRKKRNVLEKITLDYIKWGFRIDFCSTRYLITKKLGLTKLKIRWGLRAKRYEEKIEEMEDDR